MDSSQRRGSTPEEGPLRGKGHPRVSYKGNPGNKSEIWILVRTLSD